MTKIDPTPLIAEAQARETALCALLALCLPYVKDCAQDPAYKGDRVADLARRIREEVAR